MMQRREWLLLGLAAPGILVCPRVTRAYEGILFWPARIDVRTVDRSPLGLITADFDEDGRLDVIVRNDGVDSVAVYRGTGQGFFTFAGHQAADFQQENGAVADLNRDGHLDVVTANFLGDDISVLPGRGDGTFEPTSNYNAGNGPTDLAVVDVDEDSFPDIVSGAHWSQALFLFRNDGTGAFSRDPLIPLGDGPSDLEGGDFTGDGHADLAILYDYTQGNRIQLWRGDGSGGFEPYQDITPGAWPGTIAAVDANQDGFLDLVGCSQAYFRNRGDGTLDPIWQPDIEGDGRDIRAFDYDADGILDLVLTDHNRVNLVRGTGGGEFEADTSLFAGESPFGIGFGDVDDDSRPDLFTVNRWGHVISIFRADGAGSYHAPAITPLDGRPYGVVPADFSGDGNLDLAILQQSDGISIWLGDGGAGFTPLQTFPTGEYAWRLLSTDLNGDAHEDLITVQPNSHDLGVYLGNGDATFAPQPFDHTLSYPVWGATGDFDGDGDADVVVAEAARDASGVTILAGDGTGQLERWTTLPFEQAPVMVEAADIDWDGQDEVLVTGGPDGAGAFQVLRSESGGGLVQMFAVEFPERISSVESGDYNGDSRLDVALTWGTDVGVLYGTGEGDFEPAVIVPLVTGTGELRSGEFNGDGILDLAIAMPANRNVGIVFGGLFADPTPSALAYGGGQGSNGVVTGDWDGDGFDDLVVTSQYATGDGLGNSFVVFRNARGSTSIDPPGGDGPRPPRTFILAQNYPNPFNPSTTIEYDVPDEPGPVRVTLTIYDLRGRRVRTLRDEMMGPGRHAAHWDGRDENGRPVTSGTYLYRLRSGDHTSTKKMTVIR